MTCEVAGSSITLCEARDRLNRLIDVSERVIRLTAQSSLNSVDGPFIEKVRGIAAEVTAAFEEALRQGRVTEAALFDRDYKPIPGGDPEPLLAGCVAPTAPMLPAIQEPAFGFRERVVFWPCVPVNGSLSATKYKVRLPHG